MSEKDLNKEAYKLAEKEMLEKKVTQVKGYILETLERIEETKKKKERIEEELRVLKLDLEDLRNGNFEKIEERIQKSPIAKQISVHIPSVFNSVMTNAGWTGTNQSWITDWNNLTGGTYTTSNKTFYF